MGVPRWSGSPACTTTSTGRATSPSARPLAPSADSRSCATPTRIRTISSTACCSRRALRPTDTAEEPSSGPFRCRNEGDVIGGGTRALILAVTLGGAAPPSVTAQGAEQPSAVVITGRDLRLAPGATLGAAALARLD